MDSAASVLLQRLRSEGIAVNALSVDSRAVRPGDVFLAYPGAASDGRRFIGEAIRNGARAVLWERDGFSWDADWQVPHRAVEQLRHLAGPLANEVYGRPSERLWTMGVTGTNGKTSTTQWIAQACTACGARTAVVGTLGIGFPTGSDGAKLAPNPNTTPEAVTLQRSLARLIEQGAQGVAMEVSSIGLEQDRVEGTTFGAALFTNLSRDHLDYHSDMEAYARAKQRLFLMPGLKHAVLNVDDVQGLKIVGLLHGSGVHRIGYSSFEGAAERSGVESFVEAGNLRLSAAGIGFMARTSWGDAPIESQLLGRFNVSNLLGVLGMMLASGVPLAAAAAALAGLQPVTGRMQRLGGDGKPLVVVDYAHTPDALQLTLGALRDVARTAGGTLTVVFGCGGDRDRGKRPLMGAIASRHADRVVITNDNPRSESPEAIIADIAAKMDSPYQVVIDRREAVASAIASSRAGDVVLLAGKGHEAYQEIAGKRLPYSDEQQAREALEAWS